MFKTLIIGSIFYFIPINVIICCIIKIKMVLPYLTGWVVMNIMKKLDMDIINGLQVGYTYELPANGLIRESYGSHELYLAYGFNILKPKRTNRYKSVRYL